MTISFKGFKNSGVQVYDFYDMLNKPIKRVSVFNCELTNDVSGKDLDNFSSLIKNDCNPINKNFVRFSLLQNFNPETSAFENTYRFNKNEYKINSKNFNVFEKMAQLFKKIIDTPTKDFKVNNDYIDSEDCFHSFVFFEPEVNSDELQEMHKPKNVKEVAEFMLETITDDIESYLA